MEKNLKAVLSDRIYLTYDIDLLRKLSEELTYKIPPKRPGGKPQLIRNFSVVNRNIITIPSGRIDLIPSNYTIVDKRSQVEAFFPEQVDDFIKKFRPSQKEAYNKIKDNYILNAKPGWGKTFTAIGIATKLLQKTLVVVHTLGLRHQWEQEIEVALGFKPGVIGSGIFNIDSPIVIANIQSLTKVMDKLRHEFGTIIIDECHHTPASTFLKILDKSTARYKLGLSGTLQRKDGKHVLMFDYISHSVHVPEKENVMDPIVLIYKSELKIPGNHLMPWAHRINNLTGNVLYQNLVMKFANAQADRGHTVLVVSDRVEFLHDMSSQCPNSVCITSTVDDRKTLEQQVRSGEKKILFGSIGIYKEGISINEISSVILATAISNEYLIIQLVGRIIRLLEGKMRPEVVDIALAGETGKRQLSTRLRAYRMENYEVRYLN